MNLAEAKEKYYPKYKYALVGVKSNKPHSLYVDRKTAEEERCDLWKCYGAVLMIDDLVDIEVSDNQRIKKKNPFNVCDTNPNCEYDPETCGFAVEYSSFEDVSKGIHKYMCGRYKCKYQK